MSDMTLGIIQRGAKGILPSAAKKSLRAGIERLQSASLRLALREPAEDVARQGLSADIFVSFEMLEHLPSPIHFLQSLSEKTTCKAFVVTVPYVAQSRVGLHHIRQNRPDRCTPENTHIFELCPADWRLLFLHAGWSVKKEMLYLQYPRFHALRVMRTLWKRLDFEGFWGAILQRDHTWSAHYGEGA